MAKDNRGVAEGSAARSLQGGWVFNFAAAAYNLVRKKSARLQEAEITGTPSCVRWSADYLNYSLTLKFQGEAEKGRDAVEKAENLKPDLIILDLAMPVMTGLDTAPLLRKVVPDVRIIPFMVQEGREVERLARGAGIHAVVSKSQAASNMRYRSS